MDLDDDLCKFDIASFAPDASRIHNVLDIVNGVSLHELAAIDTEYLPDDSVLLRASVDSTFPVEQEPTRAHSSPNSKKRRRQTEVERLKRFGWKRDKATDTKRARFIYSNVSGATCTSLKDAMRACRAIENKKNK